MIFPSLDECALADEFGWMQSLRGSVEVKKTVLLRVELYLKFR